MNKFAFLLVFVVIFTMPLSVQAQQNIPTIHLREQIVLGSPYIGFVNIFNYEKWPFQLTSAGSFIITAANTGRDLTLLVILLDTNGNELARADGADRVKLSENRPAGDYFLLVQPRTGGGTYSLGITSSLATPTLILTTFITPTPTSTPIFSLASSATPDPTFIQSVVSTSATTSEPTFTPGVPFTSPFTPEPTFTPGVTQNSSNTTDPTYTPTIISPVSEVPSTMPTMSSETSFSSTNPACSTSVNGTDAVGCMPAINTAGASAIENLVNNLSSRANLDSGLNPVNASATLIDVSRQIIYSTSLSSDGTYLLKAPFGTFTLQLSAPGYLTAQKSVSLAAGQPFYLAETTLLAGDVNGDNEITALDLISLGAAYEIAPLQLSSADLNGDGRVDLFDLTLLAKNWRKIGPISW